jgi:DNA recombination protein RmuC
MLLLFGRTNPMAIVIALISAVIGMALASLFLHSRSVAVAARLTRAEQDLAAAQRDLKAEHEAGILLRTERAALEKTVELERKVAAEKLAAVEQAEIKLREAFAALAAEALKHNNESFLELARATLAKYQSEAHGELEQRKQAVEALVAPIRQSLEGMNQQIRTIEKERGEAYGSLKSQVASLIVTQEKLQSETGNLVKALRAPQVRGRWGEIQLRRVVEIAGMLPYCDFTEQASITGEDGRLRPDLVVHLPGAKTVVVDAKAPLQAYLDALEASDDQRRTLLGDHARQIRTHMAQLGSKAYWDQLPSTPDFVVMFLPGETFFSSALEQDPGLIEYGVSQKVIPASPTTLIAVLQAVAYGWRQEKIAESAQEISERGKELYDRLCTLAGYVRDLGTNLGRAVEQYNKAIASLEGRVLVTARKFPELGVSVKEEIPELAPVEKSVRELQSPEMAECAAAGRKE